MSCRRARRQLLWLVRFGELNQESAPHLDHLAACRACRDEIGVDRALVREIRTALAERVADAAPSPAAWDGILARMRQPDPRPSGMRGWALRFAGALRAGTAMAGAGLALVLALNLEVVPMAPFGSPDAEPQAAAERPAWAGQIPPFVDVAPPAAPVAEAEAERTFEVGVRGATEAEQLPPARDTILAANDTPRPSEPDDPDPASRPDDGWQILAVRLVPSDAERIAAAAAVAEEAADEPEPVPAPPVQGPS